MLCDIIHVLNRPTSNWWTLVILRCGSLHSVSFKNVKSCADVPDSDRSDRLRSELHHYLECQPPESVVSNGTLTFARESEALSAAVATELVPTDVCYHALPALLWNLICLCSVVV